MTKILAPLALIVALAACQTTQSAYEPDIEPVAQASDTETAEVVVDAVIGAAAWTLFEALLQ